MNSNYKYFISLANFANGFLNKLPIAREVQPLEYAVKKLNGEINIIKDTEVDVLRTLWCYKKTRKNDQFDSTGLNTIGLLADRFTILLIKEWCLRNKNNSNTKADALYQTQTVDIMKTLASCCPGNSAINSKITNIETEVAAVDWEEAFYQLLGINLVLWESQEILYIKDISLLPSEELRAYIHWFAHGNMRRNVLIELNELLFWEKASR